MISLGIDVGSSSVKVALLEIDSGKEVGNAHYPKSEMKILAEKPGWAEQHPDKWIEALTLGLSELRTRFSKEFAKIKTIGISYQMHGLVLLDKKGIVLRPSIIWCDSRAVEIGNKALNMLGSEYCLENLLNSPGNFTASKLRWVQENEPSIYEKIDCIMLPGDYIAYWLTGEKSTTITGLSEGVFWNFPHSKKDENLLNYYEFDSDIFPVESESFAVHGTVIKKRAENLGIPINAKVTYKAGDQPNNAFSLNVLNPGEVAATGGTSGVVYAVSDRAFVDKKQRVNSFAHVNYNTRDPRIGVLLCINGVGIANAWAKRMLKVNSYHEMNEMGNSIDIGSGGLVFYPFGNGAERMLGNKDIGALFQGIKFNTHSDAHMIRAVQEGIAAAFYYGMQGFTENELNISKIRAGAANMFLSSLFSQTLANLSGVPIELYNTDGALGAARGAIVGEKLKTIEESMNGLEKVKVYLPNEHVKQNNDVYRRWVAGLQELIYT